jgi:hypothetical protein
LISIDIMKSEEDLKYEEAARKALKRTWRQRLTNPKIRGSLSRVLLGTGLFVVTLRMIHMRTVHREAVEQHQLRIAHQRATLELVSDARHSTTIAKPVLERHIDNKIDVDSIIIKQPTSTTDDEQNQRQSSSISTTTHTFNQNQKSFVLSLFDKIFKS